MSELNFLIRILPHLHSEFQCARKTEVINRDIKPRHVYNVHHTGKEKLLIIL